MVARFSGHVAAFFLVTALMARSAASVPADPAAWHVDAPSSAVEFTAVGKPGFLRINGKGAKSTCAASEDEASRDVDVIITHARAMCDSFSGARFSLEGAYTKMCTSYGDNGALVYSGHVSATYRCSR